MAALAGFSLLLHELLDVVADAVEVLGALSVSENVVNEGKEVGREGREGRTL